MGYVDGQAQREFREARERMGPLLHQALSTLSIGGTEADDLVKLILDEIVAPEYLARAEAGASTEVELASLRAGLTHILGLTQRHKEPEGVTSLRVPADRVILAAVEELADRR